MKREYRLTINRLTLSTKADIPFPDLGLSVYQPTLREIGYLGEDKLFNACQLFTKDFKKIEGGNVPEQMTNFDIFMSIMNQTKENANVNKIYDAVYELLVLLFPNCEVKITDRCILLLERTEDAVLPHILDARTYDTLGDILIQMFCLQGLGLESGSDYNPVDFRAAQIAEKLRARNKILQERKKKTELEGLSIFARYQSILAVGLQKDINDLARYSVFQLMEEFQRYQLYYINDLTDRAKLAGAKNMKDVDNWMDDIQFGTKP